MPEPQDVRSWWKRFVQSLRDVFSELPEHRHLDQFLLIRNTALTIAASDQMADEVQTAYRNAVGNNETAPAGEVVKLAAMELEAFTLAAQIHAAEVKRGWPSQARPRTCESWGRQSSAASATSSS